MLKLCIKNLISPVKVQRYHLRFIKRKNSFFNPIVCFIHINCLPRGRHSEAAHEKRLLCAQKCTRGGVGWGGVGHERVGWGGVGGS